MISPKIILDHREELVRWSQAKAQIAPVVVPVVAPVVAPVVEAPVEVLDDWEDFDA